MIKLAGKAALIVPLLITLVFIVLAAKSPPIIDDYIETLLVDYRFKTRNILIRPSIPEDILTVMIDEKSLQEFGRWPWNRGLQAELINKIFEGQPKVVGIDIFYPEPESPESDRALAEAMSKHKDRLVVALGFDVEGGKAFKGEVDNIVFENAVAGIKELKRVRALEAGRALLPPGPIAGAATFGHVYSLADRDGKLRWENLYIKYGDEYIFSLALKTAALAQGIAPDKVSIIGGAGVDLGGTLIPSDDFGRLHINYIGKEGSIVHKSAADVLRDRVAEDIFRNKIVLVGTSAISTYDLKVTPFSANMPGVEKNATVISNIINGNPIRKAPLLIDLLSVLFAGAAAFFIAPRKRALYAFLYYIFLTGLIVVANVYVFIFFNTRVNMIYPLLTVLSAGTFVISYGYFIEEKKAKEIRKMFSSYVTERVVNELIRDPGLAKLGGERREITVLFSDISGFTAFSEKHEPEEVVAMLNEYLGAMTDVIFRWEGTLDKFIGDAIVAFWGAPLRQENHAELAVRCSLHMISRLEELRRKWLSEGKTPLSIGIGLNTGEVIVGNIGAEGKKMDYTVIGDHVNIGARVESLTRKFNTNILITELPFRKIIELVKTSRIGHVSVRGVGNVVVKGKEKPIRVYEIKSLPPSEQSVIADCSDETILHLKEK
ncbi:MAG: adenylate/guanylate cyclase domain-containing protein [Nitrospirae bacterium]|nr:adenylate/guanylate cyclase domain-containing protein [Nitrospirota bacterium]